MIHYITFRDLQDINHFYNRMMFRGETPTTYVESETLNADIILTLQEQWEKGLDVEGDYYVQYFTSVRELPEDAQSYIKRKFQNLSWVDYGFNHPEPEED